MNRSFDRSKGDRPEINWTTVKTIHHGDVVVEVTASDQARPRYSYSINFMIREVQVVRSRQLRWEGYGEDFRVVNPLDLRDLTRAVAEAEDWIAATKKLEEANRPQQDRPQQDRPRQGTHGGRRGDEDRRRRGRDDDHG